MKVVWKTRLKMMDFFYRYGLQGMISSVKLWVTELDMRRPEHDIPTGHAPSTHGFG